MNGQEAFLMTRTEFCRRVGITQETLRHYVDRGLIRPVKRAQNRYQLYSLADAAVVFGIREKRSLDCSLDDIEEEMRHAGTQGFAHVVGQWEEKLLARQQEIERELAQIRFQRTVCEACMTDEGRRPRLQYYHPSVSAYYDGTPQAAQRVKALAARFPYSYGVIKLPLEPGQGAPPFQLGMLLPQKAIAKGDTLDLSQYQPCACARIVAGFDVPDLAHASAADFMAVIDYAKRHNFRVMSDIVLVVHHVYRHDGTVGGVVTAGVGVDDTD